MRLALAFVFAVAAVLPARAEPNFAGAVERVITDVIGPGYQALASAAEDQSQAMQALCDAPSESALETARDRFEAVVLAWSAVELIRFGPAREDNRFEKLFYWPDRKGRGLKQVQAILATQDETARAADRLRGKSVAVQGLPALEFVLQGTGAEELATGAPYRCAYGKAIAAVVAANAEALRRGWSEDGAFARSMRDAGGVNTPYQSHAEAVQDFMRAATEQLQVVRDLKIGASIGDTPEKAKPKRAPFWRSGLTLAAIMANLRGVEAMMSVGLDDLLPDEHARYAGAVAFELKQAKNTLDALIADGGPWLDVAAETEGHQKLSYVMIPLAGATRVIAENYPAALGLTLGFNSLDGD